MRFLVGVQVGRVSGVFSFCMIFQNEHLRISPKMPNIVLEFHITQIIMTRIPVITTAFFCLLCVTACSSKSKQVSGESSSAASAVDTATVMTPVYAKGYAVKYLSDNVRLVDIHDPQNESNNTFQFALVPRGAKPTGIPTDYAVIETPVEKVICMTSLQLSNFISLGACNRVVGITSTRHLFNQEMNGRIKSRRTTKIGIEGNFDNELIMSLNPGIIFISPFKRGGYDAMRETGIPLVPHLGYKEMTPLGQAEWIKVVGMFIGQEAEATAKFAAIEQRYNELKELAANVKKRPLVFSGEIRGGNWYAVGGRSFLAELFRDAGADYFLKDDPRSGGVMLDFETVYSQAESADFWRIVNSYDGTFSYDALKAVDARYADFRAFRERGVVYCNMREKPFYESMPMEPEIVLEDLIHAFHPGLLPEYEPTYYERLKE